MEILRNDNNLKIVINTEQDFKTDLGWRENLTQFENEVLSDVINPAINYETVRYIHHPYISSNNIEQTDIWFNFYFTTTGNSPTYVLDYNPVGITTVENELMTKQSTQSFFRLELYKTPGIVSGGTLLCDPPTRQNRRLVNSKNLSLPLGEKFFYTDNNFGYYIHVPIFTGSNYRNKENMYLFWFDDESVLTDTNLSGTTTLDQYTFNNTGSTVQTILFTNEINEITQINIPTGTTVMSGWTGQTFTITNVNVTYGRNYYHGMNTFFMTAKFFDAKNGQVLDFTNSGFTTGHTITEQNDMYYQVDFDNFERTYKVYQYNGTKGSIVGNGYNSPITFYEKGGATIPFYGTPTPTPTPSIILITPTPIPTFYPTRTPTPTPTPVPEVNSGGYYYTLSGCSDGQTYYSDVYPNIENLPFSQSQIDNGLFVYDQNNNYYIVIEYYYLTYNPAPNYSLTLTDSGLTSCPTPTPTPTLGGPTSTPTSTPTGVPSTPTPTPTLIPYTVTGNTIAGSGHGNSVNGRLTILYGTVDVTLTVFGGTSAGGSNNGTVTTSPYSNLNLSVMALAFNQQTQTVTLSAGVYNFTITSSTDNNKTSTLTFS